MRYEPIREFQDRGLKWLLASRERVVELMSLVVPRAGEVVESASLRLIPQHLVNARLGLSDEDVVWQGRLQSGVRVTFLIALQARPDPLIPFRLGAAVTALDQAALRDLAEAGVTPARRRVPLVVPVLLSTCPHRWRAPRLAEKQEAAPELEPFVRAQEVATLDLASWSEEALLERGGALGCVLLVYRAQRAPLERFVATLDRALAHLRARSPDRERFLGLVFHCFQLAWHRRRPEDMGMIERTVTRHTERKEAGTMAQTMAEATRVAQTREDVLKFLEARFERVPAGIARAVRKLDDPTVLEALIRQAARAESLAEFRAALPTDGAKRSRAKGARARRRKGS